TGGLHSGVMGDTVIETRPANPKAEEWAERIAIQQRSGKSVKQFCKEQGLTEYSFYAWRKRLQESGPVRFALVERSAHRQGADGGAGPGTDVGDRGATAHRNWRGYHDLAGRAGHAAGMIHLLAWYGRFDHAPSRGIQNTADRCRSRQRHSRKSRSL